MSCYAGHEWGSGVPIQGKYHSKWAKYSLKIGEIELIYARSAFKMFSKHKSMPGALHERSLPRGSLTGGWGVCVSTAQTQHLLYQQ